MQMEVSIVCPGIVVGPKESFEEAYRRFKRQCDRNLIVTEARARQHYEPPTREKKNREDCYS